MTHLYEVDGEATAPTLHRLNAAAQIFPTLEPRHLRFGHWWCIRARTDEVIGFAGMVPMTPFRQVGYLKRAYIHPDFRGQGLQLQLLRVREERAHALNWHTVVGECKDNPHSAANFLRAGYTPCTPEQGWGEPGSIYFVKYLSAPLEGSK